MLKSARLTASIPPKTRSISSPPSSSTSTETCIDGAACEPVCPVTAIFPDEELPDKWKDYVEKNTAYYNK